MFDRLHALLDKHIASRRSDFPHIQVSSVGYGGAERDLEILIYHDNQLCSSALHTSSACNELLRYYNSMIADMPDVFIDMEPPVFIPGGDDKQLFLRVVPRDMELGGRVYLNSTAKKLQEHATVKTNKTGKFLAWALRHGLDDLGMRYDEQGRVDMDALCGTKEFVSRNISKTDIKNVAACDSKLRFIIEGNTVRASQGHSVEVNHAQCVPPKVLYHGTALKNVSSIEANGIRSMSRVFVHLSEDIETANAVGRRHGTPYVLTLDTQAMLDDGIEFYKADNAVWMVKDYIPYKYVTATTEISE